MFFLGVIYATFQIEDEHVYCAGHEHFWRWGRMRFELVTKTFVLEPNMMKTCIQTSPTHLASSDFQTELIYRRLLLTGTHLRKWVVAIHALVLTSKYATSIIAFSVGLNGLQLV